MRKNEMKIKILFHILAIYLFLFGCVVMHIIINTNENFVNYFGIILSRSFFFDLSIMFIGISFFIEFFMTFKPIKIVNFSFPDKYSDGLKKDKNEHNEYGKVVEFKG